MALVKQLTIKEKQYLDAYVETGNLTKAGLIVRPVSDKMTAANSTAKVIKRGNVQARIEQICDEQGLTEHYIVKKIMDKTKATRPIFITNRGIITETKEIEDHNIQLKATDMAINIRGMNIQRHANLNVDMTYEELKSLQNSDLDSMLRQCDNELERLQE